SDGMLVYLKDIQFDTAGNPVLLYLNSKTHLTDHLPRQWMIAQWSGKDWQFKPAMQSDHNYDFGQLWMEPDAWRIIAPTEPGPQPEFTGGDIALWLTTDQGITWNKSRVFTHSPSFNHTYVRQPINAQDDFYAFWADGDATKKSASHLYFTNKTCDK